MRKKISIILLALGAAAAMYSLVACMLTRGLSIYRLGTKLGAVLAGSWQYTTAAAVVLIAAAIIPWILKLTLKKQDSTAPAPEAAAPAAEPAPVPAAPKKKLFGGMKKKLADAVQSIPAAPQEPVQQPVYQQPVQPVQQPVYEQPVQPVQQPVYEQPVQPVQQPVYEQPTQPLQQPVYQQPAQPVQQPAATAFCPMCGAPVKPGGKFCTACGAQLGGNE